MESHLHTAKNITVQLYPEILKHKHGLLDDVQVCLSCCTCHLTSTVLKKIIQCLHVGDQSDFNPLSVSFCPRWEKTGVWAMLSPCVDLFCTRRYGLGEKKIQLPSYREEVLTAVLLELGCVEELYETYGEVMLSWAREESHEGAVKSNLTACTYSEQQL